MKKFLFPVILFFFSLTSVVSQSNQQEHNLAIQYFQSGEYEKAIEVFTRLYQNNPTHSYYRYLYNSYLRLEDYDSMERLIDQQRKNDPNNLSYLVDLGNVYFRKGQPEKANNYYQEALKNMQPNRGSIMQLANAFIGIQQHELAIQTYSRGRQLISNYNFYAETAHIYRILRNHGKMIEYYLKVIDENPNQQQSIMNIFQDNIGDEGFEEELQRTLYRQIQQNPGDHFYSELLVWYFIQKKDFDSAYRQVRALDRRNNEQGGRVFELGNSAMTAGDYDAAIQAFEYVLTKGSNNRHYFNAREGILSAKRNKVVLGHNYDEQDLLELEKEYNNFLQEFATNRARSASAHRELAHLYIFYLHQEDKGIVILENLMKTPGISGRLMNEIKLDLGDAYLMTGEIWEASLLYSQVDKDLKDDPLGGLARFKNARLSYFNGDFDWAKTQLDAQKISTSDLLANDALDLSIFITSHLGLDTTTAPLRLFARADLLVFQNRFEDAFRVLDSLKDQFPFHTLTENVLMLKAQIHLKQNNLEKAISYLKEIHTRHGYGLLAPRALFLLGDIYQYNLDDSSKAMDFYQKIILDHPGSLFVMEARERFRTLRGDIVN